MRTWIYISISYKYDILNWTVEWFLSWVKEGRLFSSSPSDCDLPVHNCFWLHHTAVVSIRKCHDGTRHFEDGKGKDKSTIGPADKRKRKFKYNDDATIQIEPTVSKACPPPPLLLKKENHRKAGVFFNMFNFSIRKLSGWRGSSDGTPISIRSYIHGRCSKIWKLPKTRFVWTVMIS